MPGRIKKKKEKEREFRASFMIHTIQSESQGRRIRGGKERVITKNENQKMRKVR